MLREALRHAATERRSEVKTQPALVGPPGKRAERRLVQMLMEADEFRSRLVREVQEEQLYRGLETEKIFAALVEASPAGERPDVNALATALSERDRRLLFEIAFEGPPEAAWAEAESCLDALRLRKTEDELAAMQGELSSHPAAQAPSSNEQLRKLLARKLSSSENKHTPGHLGCWVELL